MSEMEQIRRSWQIAQNHIAGIGKVFVVGCAKSGTTWLMNLLNGHPAMVVMGEGRFGWRLIPFLSQAFRAFNEDQAKFMPDPLMQLRDVDLIMCGRMLVDMQLFRYIEASGKLASQVKVVGDKTPQHATCLPLLSQLYPDARFIHIIRDPRDAATSGWHHFGKDDTRSREEYFRHFVEDIWPASVATARRFAPPLGDRYMEVRYEDMLADEHGYTRRCLQFLGVDASDAAVNACLEAGSFKSRSGGRDRGQEDKGSFYRRGVSGDWENHMTPDLAQKLCIKVARLMRDCGYEPEAKAAA